MMEDQNQNKTLFTDRQIHTIAYTLIMLGFFVFIWAMFSLLSNHEKSNELAIESEVSETAEALDPDREFEYQQSLDIDKQVNYINGVQNEYDGAQARFDTGEDAFIVSLWDVNYKLDVLEAEDGNLGAIARWESHIDNFQEWASEFTKLSADPEMITYIYGENENEIIVAFIGSDVAYDIVNGYAE